MCLECTGNYWTYFEFIDYRILDTLKEKPVKLTMWRKYVSFENFSLN